MGKLQGKKESEGISSPRLRATGRINSTFETWPLKRASWIVLDRCQNERNEKCSGYFNIASPAAIFPIGPLVYGHSPCPMSHPDALESRIGRSGPPTSQAKIPRGQKQTSLVSKQKIGANLKLKMRKASEEGHAVLDSKHVLTFSRGRAEYVEGGVDNERRPQDGQPGARGALRYRARDRQGERGFRRIRRDFGSFGSRAEPYCTEVSPTFQSGFCGGKLGKA
ncbi:hypothetical protein DFH06DRAFT_1136463 [Mycena polygramma]|nr:hypothetical protein DFH06DRAFT_1136463 [Mycena polygramma]